MSAPTLSTARWSRGGYAQKRSWPHCKYCGRASQEGDCRPVSCLACGSVQCFGNGGSRGTCAVCLHGWLPGWSHGYGDERLCGYKGCGAEAVAYAPRVKLVCKPHLERVKLRLGARTVTLAIYVAERTAERDSGKGNGLAMPGWRWVQ